MIKFIQVILQKLGLRNYVDLASYDKDLEEEGKVLVSKDPKNSALLTYIYSIERNDYVDDVYQGYYVQTLPTYKHYPITCKINALKDMKFTEVSVEDYSTWKTRHESACKSTVETLTIWPDRISTGSLYSYMVELDSTLSIEEALRKVKEEGVRSKVIVDYATYLIEGYAKCRVISTEVTAEHIVVHYTRTDNTDEANLEYCKSLFGW
jgi:hypothetical protein